ncbi:MAG: TlpA family protein disulfide reductase [Saprospiraceae bacterium]|jgi:peroxiredoxin|nr:TlpA family protein disulfide reductase [Saprospiraceae bacterium]
MKKSLTLTFFTASVAIVCLSFISPKAEKEVQLTCNVNACDKVDSLYLYEFNGVNFKKAKTAPTTDWATYRFKLPASAPRFYYVGIDPNNMKPVILGTENSLTLNGSCAQFQGAQLPDSDLNRNYEVVKNKLNSHKNEFGQLLQQLQAADRQNNVDMVNAVIMKLSDLDKRRLSYLDSLKKTSPYLGKVAAINTYVSYQANGSPDMTELEHFATKYFQFVDWKDADYNYMPWVVEQMKSYVQTLAGVGFPDAVQVDFLDKILAQIPAESRTHLLAMGGIINGLQAAKSPILGTYAKRYIEKYQKKEPEAAAQVAQLLKMSGSFVSGGEAPDFTMNDRDGKPVKLSDFRGKVMLVDFWASWCGPCRRENPHVVELYHKYHSKGFDVLGVSLDKTREPWLAAIEKDGLTWNHVSDLKGWSNDAAQLYGVSSIPHTVLVDRDGKIIARNLRGEQLTAKLREILGE